MQLTENSKYTPLKDVGIGGIIVMRYGHTDQPEELVEPVSGTASLYHLLGDAGALSVSFEAVLMGGYSGL